MRILGLPMGDMIEGMRRLISDVLRFSLLVLPVAALFAQGDYRIGGGRSESWQSEWERKSNLLIVRSRSEQDALRVDPAHYRLEFENQSTRVLRLKVDPHEEDLMHYSADALVVCLSGCDLNIRQADGQTVTIHLKAGETRWTQGGRRAEGNIGNQPVEMLFIEHVIRADSQ
jgi:hypothetical protein